MKTFTVTFHHSNNYGALLQAYALQQTILALGYDNTVMEYPYENGFFEKVNVRRPKAAAAAVYHNLNKLRHKQAILRREESFRAFHRRHLRLSRVFRSMEDLRSADIDADVLITGSDQVWRFLGNREFIPARFLDFGRPDAKRISYAASLEKPEYTEEQKKLVQNWLHRFSAVSLREESARRYIGDLTGKKTVSVLDPVFLLTPEDWSAVAAAPRRTSPYILCYQVQSNPEMQRTVAAVKKMTGLTTVAVLPGTVQYIQTDATYFDVSPEEFIGLYQNASAVVSGSFHGTALGALFGKPTYAAIRQAASSRIEELAQLLGMQPFCIRAGSAIPAIEAFPVRRIADIIAAERKKSLAFLKNALMD